MSNLVDVQRSSDGIPQETSPETSGATAPPPVVEIVAAGNLGNRMIEYMAGLAIAARTPGCRIAGVDFPEWGISHPVIPQDGRPVTKLTSQKVDVDGLAAGLRAGSIGRVVLAGYCQDIANFLPVERYRPMFQTAPEIGTAFGPEHLLISVRGNEILSAPHPDYVLLPLDYYQSVIGETGLQPVFMGQLTPSIYMDALRARFPHAIYIESGGPLADFQTIRKAANIVLSVSTFSWLAAWLSDAARIFMPVSGLFNPLQSTINLLPADDPRFVYDLFPLNYAVPVGAFERAHAVLKDRWTRIGGAELQSLVAGPRHAPRRIGDYLPYFREGYYLKRYIDVGDAIAMGLFSSGADHYRRCGFDENRDLFDLDNVHYSIASPDAARDVAHGKYLDFRHHYVTVGHRLGLDPYPARSGANETPAVDRFESLDTYCSRLEYGTSHEFRLAKAELSMPLAPGFIFGSLPSNLASVMFSEYETGSVACRTLKDGAVTADGIVVHRGTALSSDMLNNPETHARDIVGRLHLDQRSLPVRRLARRAAIMTAPGYTIWGHWLVDILPKLFVLERMGLNILDLDYIVPNTVPRFAVELLKLIGIQPGRLVTYDEDHELLEAPELLLPGNLRRGSRISPLFANAVAGFVARVAQRHDVAPPPDSPPRIFVSRRRSDQSRNLVNRDAIEAIAVEKGFAVVFPGELPIVDQIALFRGARQIVGEYGSGLHNCIYSAPGAAVCALRSTSHHPGFIQSGIAQVLKQRIGYVFGPATTESTDQSFKVDEDDFGQALRALDMLSRMPVGLDQDCF